MVANSRFRAVQHSSRLSGPHASQGNGAFVPAPRGSIRTLDANDIHLAAHVAELVGEPERPPIEAPRDPKRHRHAVGPEVFTFESESAGAGVKVSVSDRRVLPAGIRNTPDLSVRLDDEIEQHFGRLAPSS